MYETEVGKICKLFDQIQDIYPDKLMSLMVHDVCLETLNEDWIVIENTAKRVNPKNEYFDITLFQ